MTNYSGAMHDDFSYPWHLTVLFAGLLLSIFFVVHRYNDLQRQLEDAGVSIIPAACSFTEYGMSLQNRESIGQLISVLHRRHSDIVVLFRFMMKITDSLSPPIFILIPHQCSSAATCRFLASSLSLVTARSLTPLARRLFRELLPRRIAQ